MNAKQLAEIQARAEQTTKAKYIGPNDGMKAVSDRLDLLAEHIRLYRSNERKDEKIRQVRELTHNLEDQVQPGDYLEPTARALREIVGPR